MTVKKKHKSKQFSINGNRRLRAIISGFFRLIGRVFYRFNYEGMDNVPSDGAFILAANHTSIVDIIAIHTGLKRWLHWVAKKELFETPIVGYVMPRMGAIPVNREKVDLSAARGIFSVLQAGSPVAMFPQGTRVKPEDINSTMPKTGIVHFAAKTNSLIVPVAIAGQFHIFRKTRIIFGKPFSLDFEPGKKYSQQEFFAMTIDVMKRIYKLADIDYEPDYNVTAEK